MPSVDNRVVQMRFDNKEFESGVGTSLGTIDKLKKALNFKGVYDGFNEIENASKKLDFSSLSNAVDSISSHFSAFGLIGDQVLRRIGDSIYDLEMKAVGLVKSMSVDQITAGWTKYGDKTASVQTIINSTGKSIDEVNKYLDRLMWYSDETSFGFTDMTSALQTMTASGGDLDDLIPMLMGIGNAVAYAGKGASEFSRAIQYSITQAYSLGYMGTKDWMTIQGSGINSKALQEELIRSAEELGKIDPGSYDLSDFSKALSDKIFDKEVMERAFGKFAEVTLEAEKLVNSGMFDTASEAYEYLSQSYTGIAMSAALSAQEAKTFIEAVEATKDAVSSGWMRTFELLFGNYVEAKQIWTWLANEWWDVFAGGAENRNDMLKIWHVGIEGVSGYAMAIESLKNVWYSFKDILYAIKDAIAEVFPPTTAGHLIMVTQRIRDVTRAIRDLFTYDPDSLDDTSDAIITLQKIIRGIAAAIDIVGQAISAVWNVVAKPALKGIAKLLYPVFEWLGKIGDKIFELSKRLRNSRTFVKILEGVTTSLKNLKKQFDTFISKIKNLESFKTLVDRLKTFKEQINGLKIDILTKLSEKLSSISGIKFDGLSTVLDGVVIGIDWILTNLNKLFDLIEKNGPAVENFFKTLDFSSVGNFFSSIGSNVGTLFNGIFDKVDFGKIKQKAKEIFGNVWDALVEFIGGINLGDIGEALKKALGLAGDAGLIALLIGIVRDIFNLGDFINSGKGVLDAFAEVLSRFGGAIKAFQNKMNAEALLKAAEAVGIIALSMLVLSFIPTDKLSDIAVSLGFLTLMLSFLVGALAKIRNTSGMVVKGFTAFQNTISVFPKTAAYTIVAVAGAVLMLVNALKQIIDVINKTSPDTLRDSLIMLGAFVAGISGFTILISRAGGKNMDVGMALSLVGFAGAILIVVKALENIVLAKLDKDRLITAGSVIAGIIGFFALVAVASKTHHGYGGKDVANFLLSAASFASIMAAVNFLLVPALQQLALIPMGQLIAAGSVIAGIMLVFTIMTALLGSPLIKDSGAAIKSLLSIALVIGVIAASFFTLSQLPVTGLISAGVAMLAMVAALTAATAILTKIPFASAVLLSLGQAVMYLGIGVGAAAVGVLAFAEALVILSDTSLNCAEAGRNLAEGIVAFLKVLIDNAPVILEFIGMILAAILAIIIAHKSKLASTIVDTATAVIGKLSTWLQGNGKAQLIIVLASVLAIVIGFLEGSIGPLTSTLIALALMAINGLTLAIAQNGGQIWAAIGNLIAAAGSLLMRGINMLLETILNAIENNPVLSAIFTVITGKTTKEMREVLNATNTELDTFNSNLISTVNENQKELHAVVEENTSQMVGSIKGMGTKIGEAFGIAKRDVDTGERDWAAWAAERAQQRLDAKANVTIDADVDATEAKEKVETALTEVQNQAYEYDLDLSPRTTLNPDAVDTNGFLGGIFDSLTANVGNFDFSGIGSGMTSMVGEGMLSGVTDNLNIPTEAGTTLADTLINATNEELGIQSPSTVAMEQGEYYVEGLSNGVIEKATGASSPIYQATEVVTATLLDGLSTVHDDFYDVGKNADQGLADGITYYEYIPKLAAKVMATAALQSAKDALRVESPSKEFEEIGMYSDMGFANGLDEYSYLVESSSESVSDKTLDAFKESIDEINDAMDSDINTEPHISPVVDFNDIDKLKEEIAHWPEYIEDTNGWMVHARGGRTISQVAKDIQESLGIKADEAVATDTSSDLANSAAASIGGSSGLSSSSYSSSANTEEIIKHIDKIDARIEFLGGAIDRINLIIDPDSLVGAIMPKIDEALGQKIALMERGA